MTNTTISRPIDVAQMTALFGDLGYQPTAPKAEYNDRAETPEAIAEAIGATLETIPADISEVVNKKGYTYVKVDGRTAYIHAPRTRQNGHYVAITDRFLDKYPADTWGWEYHPLWSPSWATVMSDEDLADFAEAVIAGSTSVRVVTKYNAE